MRVIEILKQYRDEILKAEIGVLLFNLGKTHIGFWKEKNGEIYFSVDDNAFKSMYGYQPFTGYKKYYELDQTLGKSPFEYELEQFGLKDFVFNEKVKFPFNVEGKNEIKWVNFFKGDALEDIEEGKDFIKKIFFRGCENINSGIDKGSPTEQLKSSLWLANAFGSFKEKINEFNFDKRRQCFFMNLSRFLYNNNYYANPNWKEIRNFIIKELKDWYSHLLSDSRFPVNDVTLFDQAYMTASMFKAVLAQLIIDNSKLSGYLNNPSSIKWRILGIQYDKMGLAEKGFKLASIRWYREISEEIDNEIKKILEIDYPIGNEIYRDETGIYFIVGEDIGEDIADSNLAKLKGELKELKDEILKIFKNKADDEFYPAIFLTKASRGLMNLSTLLEKAKENFLKADFSKKDLDLCLEKSDSGKAIGICPICQIRLIYEKDKEKRNSPTICEICDDRIHHKQISKWLADIKGETIWTTEIKDNNDRLAYVSLKFELNDWLSGDLLNSSFINKLNWNITLNDLVNDLKTNNGRQKKLKDTILKKYVDKALIKNLNLQDFVLNIILQRSIGHKWEEFIKKKLSNPNLIDFNNRTINWNSLNDDDIKFLAELILQFLLRKNPSPARLRRIWETTQEFFEEIHKNLDAILQIPEWRKKRLVWEVDYNSNIKPTGEELEGNGLLFWAQPNEDRTKIRVYLISSIRDFLKKFGNNAVKNAIKKEEDEESIKFLNEILSNKDELMKYLNDNTLELKQYFEDKQSKEDEIVKINLDIKNISEIHSYKPYTLITDISPVNYQVIIPACYLPTLIDNVLELYNKEFKYVYGKLSLHIGVVISDYKKPVYINLKALRKIRRDVRDTNKLWINEDTGKFCQLQKEKLSCVKTEEKINNTESYYSLYFNNLDDKEYSFYIKPDKNWKYWISTIDKFSLSSKVKIIPNTFDFEFIDTNTRRNDIYYDEDKNYRRALDFKSNRPYELEIYWKKFKKFRELFKKILNPSKLHKVIQVFYDKLQNYERDFNPILASVLINVLELNKNNEAKRYLQDIYDLDHTKDIYQELVEKINPEKIKLFIDMFEFWYKALKEGRYEQ